MGTIKVGSCPVCGSTDISKKLAAKDYTVSQQSFDIWECANCTLRFTQDIPDLSSVGEFYRSNTYISHTDTNEGLINKLYHFVRQRTLQQKMHMVKKTTRTKKGTLLDIGAGTGAFAKAAELSGWTVTGLEPDAATRERAAELRQLTLQNTDRFFEQVANSFDAITLWHVLEHVHELQATIKQIKKLLKSNGRAFIAVPNYTSYDAEAYERYWAAYDVPRHLYHFSSAAMEELVKRNGMQVLQVKPMWYDSFYISMLSEQYKNGKNNLVKAMWTGLCSNITALFNRKRCSSLIYIIGK